MFFQGLAEKWDKWVVEGTKLVGGISIRFDEGMEDRLTT